MLMGTAYDLAAEHGLKKMAVNLLGVEDWDISKKQKLGGGEDVEPYLRKDVLYTWKLFKWLRSHLDKHQIKVYRKLLRPAYLAYRAVERSGIWIDLDKFYVVKKNYTKKRDELAAELKKRADINWNSSAQVGKVLFEQKGLPIIKRSEKTGTPSASADVLKRLVIDGYKLPKILLNYKAVDTMVKMFLNRWDKDAAIS